MKKVDISVDEKYLLMLMVNEKYVEVIEYYRHILGCYDKAVNALIEENSRLNSFIKDFKLYY